MLREGVTLSRVGLPSAKAMKIFELSSTYFALHTFSRALAETRLLSGDSLGVPLALMEVVAVATALGSEVDVAVAAVGLPELQAVSVSTIERSREARFIQL